MFYLAGIIITFFLALILLSKRGKTAADAVLAAWLGVMGLHLFFYYGYITGTIYNYPYLLGIHVPLPLLHGPFLYVYTLTATRDKGFSKKYWLHFIPPMVAYAALTKFFLLSSAEKIAVYKNGGAGYQVYISVVLIAAIISGFIYIGFSFYELNKYRKRIAEEFSNTERISLKWLRYLIYGILVIWLFVVTGIDPLIFSAVVVFVLLLGYFGINHMGIFTYRQAVVKEMANATEKEIKDESKSDVNEEEIVKTVSFKENSIHSYRESLPGKAQLFIETPPSRTKYEKSGLQPEVIEKIHRDLLQLMETKKLFKQEELSLSLLAGELGVHPNHLSQVINTCENKSFYDYINTLRIEEFKTLASAPENSRYTLLSLAFECGFNSKTSFNRNFKKITGQSPSLYLKEMNLELVSE